VYGLSRSRVDEIERRGMQALGIQSQLGLFVPIDHISHNRVAAPGKMHADLMRPAGFQPAAQVRIAPVACDDLPVRDGVAAVFLRDRHLLAVRRVTADGCVDRAGVFLQIAADDALIGSCQRVVFELRGKMRVGSVVFCRNQKPRRVLVNPVDNAGALFPADTGKRIAAVMQQRVDHRPVRVPRRGVDDNSLGLVDDNHIAVFIADIERNLLRRQIGLLRLRKRQLQHHTGSRFFVLLERLPVCRDQSLRQKPLRLAAA